ncbi:LysR family transcriptional regulator [Burkholderia catarinensis]|uniref:LysR family transcriptional regulator n=1 Tax=Burkholderia catarinensis TaxID=1108140 RepID=UPI0009229F4D|nr:LysR family transcriptional regulator [Burkholderia catarinensis]KAG8151767.1 LysR family transcriptional regulator [Burkholderia catarinensis]
MFDWQDMRYFLVAARLGSLTAAARELGIDHATVGRRIARLEQAVGLKLIDRLPRSTRLTEHGVALAEAAATMQESADTAVRHLRGIDQGPAGNVTVSALPALAMLIITPSLPALIARHPGIRMTLSATSSLASLEQGDADIAIGFVRPSLPGRVVRRIGAVKFGFYATACHAERSPENWSFIGFEASLRDIPQQRWLTQAATGRVIALRSNDVRTQAEAAQQGVGIALLPSFVAHAGTRLVRIDALPQLPSRPLWMSVHADVRRSPAVRAVMDHLIAILSNLHD